MRTGDQQGADCGRNRGGVLVIQPLPGIGDMIWHLPLIHAIANAVPERGVSILTKPRSHADSLLAADPAVERILWLLRNPGQHDSVSGLRRLAAVLRKEGFRQAWILHDSVRYAFLAAWAGIPERFGYGFGLQQKFLTQREALQVHKKAHPIEKANALLSTCRLEAVEAEPRLVVAESARKAVQRRWSTLSKPWLAFGIGSSEPVKQWGVERFAALATDAAVSKCGSIFFVGGPDDRGLAEDIQRMASGNSVHMEIAVGQPVDETAALVEACDCYVGNDTGVLNLAAAVSTPAIGLFGASMPLRHSTFIKAVVPENQCNGMQGVSVLQAAEAVGELIR